MRRFRIGALLMVAALSWPAFPAVPAWAAPVSTSVRSGRWSDPAIWRPQGVPGAGVRVTIGKGTTVTYDSPNSGELAALTVQGTLTFSRERSTRLEAGGLIVRGGGVLEIGTARRPIPAGVSAELRLIVPPGATFKGGGFVEGDVGLWVFEGGRWEVHGAPVRHTWTTLARPAPAGSASLFVREDVSDWPVGAELLVTPSGAAPGDGDFEERRLAQVRRRAEGLYELHLSAPLARAHGGGEGPGAVVAEVALLSRNVRIASKYADRTHAHTMYMAGARGALAYADFADL
ncbi:MAG: G8 domain-containing protein, partial [Gemmatimonadales bacterium]